MKRQNLINYNVIVRWGESDHVTSIHKRNSLRVKEMVKYYTSYE